MELRLRFPDAARVVANEARSGGLDVPVFRCPPRQRGLDRTLCRREDGTVVVAVRLSGRPFVAVLADLVEGVVVTNGLSGEAADRWRRRLWCALAAREEGVVVDGPFGHAA